MKSYLIESLAPLLFRAGKPMNSQAYAQDVVFPLPSVASGLIRYLVLEQSDDKAVWSLPKDFQDEKYTKILSIQTQGPFLVRYSNDSDLQILLPKPANALYLQDKDDNTTKLVRLLPKSFDGEGELCGSDLPKGLLHVQTKQNLKGKPAKGVSFWTLQDFKAWQAGQDLDFQTVNKNGLNAIPVEIRTHVAIDDVSLASQAGKLFQTASYDLAHQSKDGGWQEHRLGFLIQSYEALAENLVTFGGERRLSYLKTIEPNQNISLAFDIQQSDVDKINQTQGFSLSFMTPCIFAQGTLPAWIDKDSLLGILPDTQIKVQLKAVAIERWQAVSGWDGLLWQPKATRRAISAGSVYWFAITDGQFDLATLKKLSHHVWSDNTQDSNDGFGSAIISAWIK